MTDPKDMTDEEIQELAVKAQKQIEGAIHNALMVRRALCHKAASNPKFSDSIKAANSVLIDLLQAHSDGIDALNLAPSVVIMPQFGDK